MAETSQKPLLHILVVGFHHKKGCQVEFSYPSLASSWKYFPTLALPDGSHNFSRDSVYFNLPSLSSPSETIFGVSCYRQIPVEKLKNRTSDVTRSTVQKSVTALCSVPIYGYIEVKLGLIADCFFNQGDFERTEILVNAYEQLNACLLDNNSPYERVPGLSPVESLHDLTVDTSGKRNMFHIGLPLRDLVLRWRQKILVLFKLLLLQRRIVCFGSPVRPMCDLILSIASLHPQLLELGFREVACVRTSRPMSPMPDFPSNTENNKSLTDFPTPTTVGEMSKETKSKESANTNHILDTASNENYDDNSSVNDTHKSPSEGHKSRGFSRDTSVDALAATLTPLCAVNAQEWGAPLPIFTGGCLCLPYLSLPYMDLLTDPSVIGYFIGTSNILFQQKRNLADLLVDVESMQMDVVDVELRRQIQLTTEDLRFFDHILRHVQYPKEEAEGSDRWIREQFQGYVLALLRTTVQSTTKTEGGVATKEVETFNSVFVNQFKRTNCYVDWREANMDFEQRFAHIPAGHPFAGTMSVQDVKLKLANSMQSTEGGRKLNQAVNTTSKAVGGAITNAKGALSNWWSSMTTQQQVTTREDDGTAGTTTTEDTNDNDDDLEIVAHLPVSEDFSRSLSRRVVDREEDANVIAESRSVEIGTPAEEFLESEVEVAKQEVPPVPLPLLEKEQLHKAGDVFTV